MADSARGKRRMVVPDAGVALLPAILQVCLRWGLSWCARVCVCWFVLCTTDLQPPTQSKTVHTQLEPAKRATAMDCLRYAPYCQLPPVRRFSSSLSCLNIRGNGVGTPYISSTHTGGERTQTYTHQHAARSPPSPRFP